MDYLVDPGFYCSDSSLLLNNNVWDKLDDMQRQAVIDSAVDWESDSAAHFADDNEDMIRILEETGAQVNALVGADREEFLKIANDSAWKTVEDADAEIAAKMREFAGN
jgi:TRAP-type C4-dicarboxylate transport system substrate-binding protein